MLYATTNSIHDVYTPRHTLCRDRDINGGLYVPFRPVVFSGEDILALKEKSFGAAVADILNLFFSAGITGWEVDFAIGRKPVRFVAMSHKILVAELFNNPGSSFAWTVDKLRALVVPSRAVPETSSQWTRIAVRIALLFGIFGQLQRSGLAGRNQTVDISVAADDFVTPMAVLYAKEMGLPVGRIVFGCNENSGLWDMLHHGQLHTNRQLIQTETPECDQVAPSGLERLIHSRLGISEAKRYFRAVTDRTVFTVTDEARSVLSEGFFSAVITHRRRCNVIGNVFSTNQYLLDPCGALAYGALQDFRAIQNETGPALILSDHGQQSPHQASPGTEE